MAQRMFVPPMLLASGPLCGDARKFAYEVKWDGMRAQVRVSDGKVELRSRPGRLCTSQFPELVPLRDHLGDDEAVLDGELVCLDTQGRPDFFALRRRLTASSARAKDLARKSPAVFIAFDLLQLGEQDLCAHPYRERRARLHALGLHGPAWRTPAELSGDLNTVVAATAELGLEGVVAKQRDSTYRPGARSDSWIKLKQRRVERLLVSGFRCDGNGRAETLVLARSDRSGSRYAGEAACKLARIAAPDISEVLKRFATGKRSRGINWLTAGLVAEVSCHGVPERPVRDAVVQQLHIAG